MSSDLLKSQIRIMRGRDSRKSYETILSRIHRRKYRRILRRISGYKPMSRSVQLHITERDMKIFTFIGKRGCASLEILARTFWPQRVVTTCSDRLNQLTRAEYLSRQMVQVRRKDEKIYALQKKARMLFDEDARKAFYRRLPAVNEMRHALDMGDILDAFGSKVIDFTNEHQLKSLNAKQVRNEAGVPDGHVVLEQKNGQLLSIYLERDGAYYGSVLDKKVEDMGRTGQPILWICDTTERVVHVAAVCKAYETITVVRLEDLKNI